VVNLIYFATTLTNQEEIKITEDNLMSTPQEQFCSMIVKNSCPTTRHGGACGERRYSSYSILASALEWSLSRPSRYLPPRKRPPVPIVQEAGWASEPVWTQRPEEKSTAPAGDRTPIARSTSS